MASENPRRLAVFVDVENIAGALQNSSDNPLAWIKEEGKVYLARAYGNWTNPGMAAAIKSLQEVGCEFIQPSTNLVGKNSADMHLALDALELCLSGNPPEAVLILSNDRDFVPLILKLRERHIRVVGAGIEGNTSKDFLAICDRFVPLKAGAQHVEVLPARLTPLPVVVPPLPEAAPVKTQEKQVPGRAHPASGALGSGQTKTVQSNGQSKGQEAIRALLSVLSSAASETPPRLILDLCHLGAQLKKGFPGLSIKAEGFSTLTALVNEAEALGLVKTFGQNGNRQAALAKSLSKLPLDKAKQSRVASPPRRLIDPAALASSLGLTLPSLSSRSMFCTHVVEFFRGGEMLFFEAPSLLTLKRCLMERFMGFDQLNEEPVLDDLLTRLLDSGGIRSIPTGISLGQSCNGQTLGKKGLAKHLNSSYIEQVLEANPGCRIEPLAAARWLLGAETDGPVALAASSIELAERRIAGSCGQALH